MKVKSKKMLAASLLAQSKPPPSLENVESNWPALLIALMMLMAPAMGVPSEEMLQDTLKSIIVVFGALLACLVFLMLHIKTPTRHFWHPVLLLPLLLAIYAVGSMAWSHAYLGGAEAVRWLIFCVILWLGINNFSLAQLPRIALGIHIGATIASIWAALQFWFDFSYFPQGPNPASTFVNRNFLAEFVVCTLPFSIFLITREKKPVWAYSLTFCAALQVTTIMMTGTRSALIALLLLGFLFVPFIRKFRGQLEASKWGVNQLFLIPLLFVFSILALGLIPTGNAQIIGENTGRNAIDRAFNRTFSMTKPTEYTEGSFSVRAAMWKATGRMIESHPVSGVGAGAWEVQIPLYQTPGTQLETDFYAHNELLQLLAEYGLIGWLFLIALFAFLGQSALRTFNNTTEQGRHEAPLRALVLASLLAFLLVSNAGFPWRMASTGALFAISLAILAASDIRLYGPNLWGFRVWLPNSLQIKALVVAALFAISLAAYVTYQAAQAESKLVRAIKLALTISKSGQPNNPRWATTKSELVTLMREGIAINPHYRKLTPMAADELATWGDWENAAWIWDSVLASRPNVVAIASNISRAYMQMGDLPKSMDYLNRAAKLQPAAPSVRTLQVSLLTQMKRYPEAAKIARGLFAENFVDYDLAYAAYLAGTRSKDWPLAIQALEIRIKGWPKEAQDGWLKMGDVYSQPEIKNESKALASYAEALALTSNDDKTRILGKIPESYRLKLTNP